MTHNRHDDHQCAHKDMRYCRPCDAAFCADCNREWPQLRYFSPTTYYPYWTGGVSGGASGTVTVSSGDLTNHAVHAG